MPLTLTSPDVALVGQAIILTLHVTGAKPRTRVTFTVELDRGQGQREPLSQSEVRAENNGSADAAMSVTPPFTDAAEGILIATARAQDGGYLGIDARHLRVML